MTVTGVNWQDVWKHLMPERPLSSITATVVALRNMVNHSMFINVGIQLIRNQ